MKDPDIAVALVESCDSFNRQTGCGYSDDGAYETSARAARTQRQSREQTRPKRQLVIPRHVPIHFVGVSIQFEQGK